MTTRKYVGWTDRDTTKKGYADLDTRFSSYNTKAEGLIVDSVADDRAALNTLVNVTMQPAGGRLDIVGVPRIASNMTFPSNVTLKFIEGAYLAPDGGVTITINGRMKGAIEKRFGGGGTIVLGSLTRKVFPEWWGAKGDDTADDLLPLQACFTSAQTINATSGVVRLPSRYRISAGLTVDPTATSLVFQGDNRNTSWITAKAGSAPFRSLFDFPDVLCDAFEWHDLRLDGGAGVPLTDYCIYAPRISHSLIRRNDIRYSKVCGVGLAYGWDNELENNRIWLHNGDGFQWMLNLVGGINGNNHCRLVNNKIYGNAGFGVKLWYAYSCQILGNTFEQNRKAAIYVFHSCRGTVIRDNYFEANAENGLVFITPAKTVKADIIINGTDAREGLFLNLDPQKAVIIEGNVCSSPTAVYQASHVYAISAAGLRVANNHMTRDIPAVLAYPDRVVSSLEDVDIFGNTGCTKQIEMDGFAVWQSADFAEVRVHGTPQINLWPQLIAGLGLVQITTGGALAQSAGANKYSGWAGVNITGVVASSTWGITLNMADYPELAGKLIMLACYMKGPAAAGGNLWCDAAAGPTYDIDQSSYTFGTVNWNKHVLIARMPAAGAVNFGIRKCAGLAGDVVHFSRIVLAPFGAGYGNAALLVP